MSKAKISITIITLNEEDNIARCLDSVAWADDVVVVDSGSKDRTLEISREKGARVFTNPWKGYGQQKNFAQDQTKNDWVLNIDADEVVSEDLKNEILAILKLDAAGQLEARGFAVPRRTFYLGKWILNGGWYPNYLVRLANKKSARWSEPEIHEALEVQGLVQRLQSDLEHFTFEGIEDQVLANLKYAKLGARELNRKHRRPSLLKQILKPGWKFFETYILKSGWKDGWAGFVISVNAAYSIFLKFSFQLEESFKEEK
ncbi:MAG: glycosyltransferase family 2 protein [Bdellovibrionales bacterium]|nr:glycosyltransferase family 2 protein [Bdellovibrionales bacterium]